MFGHARVIERHAGIVPTPRRSIMKTLADAARLVFWLGLCVILVEVLRGPARLDDRRAGVLGRFQQQRGSHAIAMIHREETVSVLGVPVSRYIDIEDSKEVLRAIRPHARGPADRPRPPHPAGPRPRRRADRPRAGPAPGEGHGVRAPLADH